MNDNKDNRETFFYYYNKMVSVIQQIIEDDKLDAEQKIRLLAVIL